MSYSDLLERMKSNDTGAFLEMTDRYGWSVYSAIREKYSDHAVADKIYNETMNVFYHSLLNSSAEDPLDALLCAFAEQISPEKLRFDQTLSGRENAPPEIRLCHSELPSKGSRSAVRKKNGFWHCLLVLLILMTVASVLWFLIGLLMKMNFIPYYDFGYSWFIDNVRQLF